MANSQIKGPVRIISAESRLIRIPLREPATDASNVFDVQEVPITCLTDENGVKGIGFGYTIGRGGTTILEFLRKELLPLLVGQDSSAIVALMNAIRKKVHTVASGTIAQTAFATIDVALWDLMGKRLGVPTHLLLGGAKQEVPVYNTDVGWLNRSLEEMLALCQENKKRGFRAFKLKIGKPDAEEDVERVARVREAVGDGVDLMVDANQAWTLEEAIPRLKRLEPYRLVWIEEPIRTDFIQDYIELKKHIFVPIAGGESLNTAADFYEFARLRAFDIFQPDIARVGGLSEAMRICSLADAAGIKVAPHVSPELSLVAALAAENSFYIEFIPQMEPIQKNGVSVENGKAKASGLPGLGIEFDEAALQKYEVTEDALAA